MNVQLPMHLDKAGFLAWVQGREERYELAQGRVVMVVGASKAHGILVLNLAELLRGQLNRREWTVILDFGLDTGPDTLRYPDLMVDRAGGLKSAMTSAPVLLAEVLSPSTARIDFGEKPTEYLRLPSLLAYLVFSQDEPKAWVWLRGQDGFPRDPHIIAGPGETLQIAALNLRLPLSAIYEDVLSDGPTC